MCDQSVQDDKVSLRVTVHGKELCLRWVLTLERWPEDRHRRCGSDVLGVFKMVPYASSGIRKGLIPDNIVEYLQSVLERTATYDCLILVTFSTRKIAWASWQHIPASETYSSRPAASVPTSTGRTAPSLSFRCTPSRKLRPLLSPAVLSWLLRSFAINGWSRPELSLTLIDDGWERVSCCCCCCSWQRPVMQAQTSNNTQPTDWMHWTLPRSIPSPYPISDNGVHSIGWQLLVNIHDV